MKTVRIGTHNIYIKDIIIALIIAALPFLFFLYKLAPETQVWDLGFYTFKTDNFGDIYTFLYILSVKLLLVFGLTIWYLTCEFWWKHAILIPLTIELFKLMTLFGDADYIDEIEFLQSLPITIPIILILLFLSKKMNYYSLSMDLSNEINKEIEVTFREIKEKDEISLKKIKNKLTLIKKDKYKMDSNTYLERLIELRKEIYKL